MSPIKRLDAPSCTNPAVGFTLIEMLVVIAIIGILAAMVILAMQSTRLKAYDARIKSSVDQLRIMGEVYYYSNNFSFSGYDTCLADPTDDNCPGNLAADVTAVKEELNRSQSSGLAAAADADGFCVGASLATDSSQVFCKDSAGHAGLAAFAAACNTITCQP
ncbi:MAG: hypothetical protein COT71_02655 [Candidatus Andersenbacteria bacterium CG10_big_fil_rev_8_21_14_0_10_54_11]|uniref:Prepilin-type N-terminal cleavage/methylation domain-containing protein n=1 Tax=Candidatus Andersenbacteria bacterium CG10_big_fil_rev_8_21_14_0_10_54_11 TaxID=1974485 RepID=A0A2M6WZ57_9BACT|nr:MAG: hypothetical protein COT71_02655 [Candidatus Andersenbacteria bacterium CG10_big_fil_rev_8_21_14_0_10_54_11]